MPFKSEAQRRYLFAKHPEIAKRWAKEYGTPKNLPMHKRKGKPKRSKWESAFRKHMGLK